MVIRIFPWSLLKPPGTEKRYPQMAQMAAAEKNQSTQKGHGLPPRVKNPPYPEAPGPLASAFICAICG
jgi:hypothetical protein